MTKPVEKKECIACDNITTKNKLINNVLVYGIGSCQFCPKCIKQKINVCKHCLWALTKKDRILTDYNGCVDDKHEHKFISLHNSKVYKRWREERP